MLTLFKKEEEKTSDAKFKPMLPAIKEALSSAIEQNNGKEYEERISKYQYIDRMLSVAERKVSQLWGNKTSFMGSATGTGTNTSTARETTWKLQKQRYDYLMKLCILEFIVEQKINVRFGPKPKKSKQNQ